MSFQKTIFRFRLESKMNFDYISSDEEEIYMKTDISEEEVSDIGDLRYELDRFQQVHAHFAF